MALSLVGNWYTEEARGVLLSTGINVVGGDTSGLLLAPGVNVVRGRFEGLQAAGVNVASGEVRVGQVALGVNVAGSALWGVQLAGGGNVTGGSLGGIQGAGGFNVTGGDFDGVQGAAGFNVARGAVRGAQWAMGLNHAGSVTGVQVALLNVGGDVTGAQVGLINVAKVVTGVQLGLVNVSEEVRGVPLGLLSFEKKGQFHVEAWASDIQLTNLAVKFGGKYVYTTLLAGLGPDDRLQRYSLGLGLGVHLPLGERFWLDGDVAGSMVRRVSDPFASSANVLTQGRLMLGFNLFERLAVFAGPTYNAFFAWRDEDRFTLSTLPVRQERLGMSTTTVQYWPGVQLGVRI
jgi:hypothetical protein